MAAGHLQVLSPADEWSGVCDNPIRALRTQPSLTLGFHEWLPGLHQRVTDACSWLLILYPTPHLEKTWMAPNTQSNKMSKTEYNVYYESHWQSKMYRNGSLMPLASVGPNFSPRPFRCPSPQPWQRGEPSPALSPLCSVTFCHL